MSEASPASAPAPSDARPGSRAPWLWLATLVGLVFAVFAGGLGHEFVNWDDFIYITQNPLVLQPSAASLAERLATPELGYPVPLPVFVYGGLWRLGGASPWPFHLFSLCIHVSICAGLFALLRRAGLYAPAAALVSLGFGLHPLVVEPVAWATGLKDLLMAGGVLIAWSQRAKPVRMAVGGLVALSAKPVAVLLGTGLLLALLIDRRASQVERQPEGKVAPSAGSWVVAAALAVLGLGLAFLAAGSESDALRTTLDGDLQPARMGAAAGLMVSHVLVPIGLAPRYAQASVAPGMVVMGLVALIAALLHMWWWWRARDVRAGLVALSLLVYVPVSNLRPLVRFTADSYAYTPWMLVVLVVGCTLARAPRWSRRVHFVGAGLALAWGLASWSQLGVWASSVSLWEAAYEGQPDDGENVYRYGDALGRSGASREEMALYLSELESLRSAPKVPVMLPIYLERSGDADQAQEWFAHAFALPTRQDDGMYRAYLEFVARHPNTHHAAIDPAREDALRYAIEHFGGEYAQAPHGGGLTAAQREVLARHAVRFGQDEVARALSDVATQ